MSVGARTEDGSGTPRSRWRDWIAAALLMSSAIGLVLVHGFHGMAPHDQSIVFDGAWRMLQHQLPYADFVMPNGVLPMVVQSIIFAAVGVSWGAYVGHAALMNALYALVVWRGLRIAGLDEISSLLYGLGAAVVFYPPIGTPYMDQHSFFFVGCLIVTTVVIGARRQPRLGLWIPALVAFGFLSKQIPMAFALPVVLVPLMTLSTSERWRYVRAVTAGGIVTAGILALTVVVFGLSTTLLWQYGVQLPRAVGDVRLQELREVAAGKQFVALAATFGVGGFSTIASATVLGVSSAMLIGFLAMARRWPNISQSVIGLAANSTFTFPITYGFMALTFNQDENGLALVPLTYGLTQSAAMCAASGPSAKAWLRKLISVCAFALPLVFSVQVVRFYSKVVAPRTVNDMVFAGEPSCSTLPKELTGLHWAVPPRIRTSCVQFGELASYLRQSARPTWIIGDTLILYALSQQISPLPAVFYHPGLTIPSEPVARREFEDWLIRNLARQGVNRIVIEGAFTVVGSTLQDFPKAASVVTASRCGRRSFGGFEVIDLCQPFWTAADGSD